jgi:LacI family transcriptional regulator
LGFPNLSSVCTDDRNAARCAIDALVAQGHRRIAMIGGDREVSEISRLRYEGCMEAFQAYGIRFNGEKDYETVRYSYQDGYDAAKRLLAAGRSFTALFAMADILAIGAIRALRDAGLRVPEDVSVMGYDGLSIGAFLVPQLSTVGQSVAVMARESVALLLECMEKDAEARHVVVPFTIYQRESIRNISE